MTKLRVDLTPADMKNLEVVTELLCTVTATQIISLLLEMVVADHQNSVAVYGHPLPIDTLNQSNNQEIT